MLKGKAAVVTGSTSGIGLGVARALASVGADIMLNGFGEPQETESLRASFAEEFGVGVAYSAADMSRPEQARGLIEHATKELGRVDVLVNNAGVQFTAAVEEFPVEKWDQVIAINLSAAFHTIAAALPQMRTRNWGRIINVASTHGLVASTHKAAYVAAKHGLIGLTKVVALEAATSRITCNAICPGWVLTPMVQKQIDELAARDRLDPDKAREKLLAGKQPSLQFATADQIGMLAVYLASEAAAEMRGAGLPVDGGWLAQ